MNNDLSVSGTRMRQGDLLRRGTGNASAADGGDNSALAIRLLHDALIIARGVAARCERQYCAALRNHSPALAAAALEHAHEARVQADSLSARIAALGGTPAVSPEAGAPAQPARTPAWLRRYDGRQRIAPVLQRAEGLAGRLELADYRLSALQRVDDDIVDQQDDGVEAPSRYIDAPVEVE